MRRTHVSISSQILFHFLFWLLFISCSNSTEDLIEKLNNRQNLNLIRARAAYSLGERGDSIAVVYLINALKDEDNNVRWGAVVSLGKIGDSRAVEPLCRMLQDEDKDVRGDALNALGKIGDTRAIVAIKLMAQNDNDPSIRSLAVQTIKKIEKSNTKEVKLKREIDTALSKLLKGISSKGISTLRMNENIPFALLLAIAFSVGTIGILTVLHLKILSIKEQNHSRIVRLMVMLHSKLVSRSATFIKRSMIIAMIILPFLLILNFSISNDNSLILWNTIGFYYLLGVSLLWLFYGISWYLETGDKTMKRFGYVGIFSTVFVWLFYEKISLLKSILYLTRYIVDRLQAILI